MSSQAAHIVLSLLLGIASPSVVLGSDWQWFSGGSFHTVATNAPSAGSQQEVWLGGEILIRGRWLGNYWNWIPMAEDLLMGRRILALDVRTLPVPGGDGESTYLMAVTDDNRVLYSRNGGMDWAEWEAPAAGSLGGLKKIIMTGADKAFAAGQNASDKAVLLKTEDGGESWETLFASYDEGIFMDMAIPPHPAGTEISSFLLAGTCFEAEGPYGVVVETTDNWGCRVQQYFDRPMWAVAWPVDEERYALGGGEESAPIFATAINTFRWSQGELPEDVRKVSEFYFDQEGRGWLVGRFENDGASGPSGAVILWTNDRGLSWNRTDFCENCIPQSDLPLARLDLVAPVNDRLLAIQSGGSGRWPCLEIDSGNRSCSGVVIDSLLPSGDEPAVTAWKRIEKLSGYSYRFAASIEHPTRWTQGLLLGHETNPLYGISQVIFPDGPEAPLMPRYDSDCLEAGTADSGACFIEWTGLSLPDFQNFWATGNLEPGASANVGAILRTDSSISAWSAEQFGGQYVIQQMGPIQARSDGRVWLSAEVFDSALETEQRILFASDDRGHSWQEVIREEGSEPYQFAFGAGGFGCIYSSESFRCTADTGDVWVEPENLPAARSVTLTEVGSGWAVTREGAVYETSDSGQTWVEIGTIASVDDTSLSPSTFLFTDTTSGWFSGPAESEGESDRGGKTGVWKSEDSGKTWQRSFTLAADLGSGSAATGALFALDSRGRGWLVSPASGMILSRGLTGPGDANGNGLIDAGDYIIVANSLFEDPPDPSHDCNQDGHVDSGDLLCILRRLLP